MDLRKELLMFTGTENYYKHPYGIYYTDGVRYLAEKARSYWLIDAIASWQREVGSCSFQIWELRVKDGRGLLTMKEDTNEPVKVSQVIHYTDFPLQYIKLYLVDRVLMLPSEY